MKKIINEAVIASEAHFRRRTSSSSRTLSEMSLKLIPKSARARARSEVLAQKARSAKQSQTFRLLRPVHHVGRPRNDGQVLVHFALFVIRIYQRLVSPYLGAHCRFVPSCSEYAGEAIRRHGFFKGY